MAEVYFFYYYRGVGGGIYPGKRHNDVPSSPNTVAAFEITKQEFDNTPLAYLMVNYPCPELPDLQ